MPAREANRGPGSAYSQTLGRGLTLLQLVAAADHPLTLAELTEQSGFPRSVTYRLLRTLVVHHLVETGEARTYRPAVGLVGLARGVGKGLRSAAQPVLVELAETLGATAYLGVADGDEVVCLASIEPRSSGLHIVYREGLRHPVRRGASGAAILSTRPPQRSDRAMVRLARQRGYAVSVREVEPDAVAVAAPIIVPGEECDSAIAALLLINRGPTEEVVADAVRSAAARIVARMGLSGRD